MRTIRYFGVRLGILLVLVAYTTTTKLVAQTSELSFEKFTSSNGISLGKINAMTQDTNGFMWFSDQTNRSIYRYDGSHLTKYPYNPTNPNSLGGRLSGMFYDRPVRKPVDRILWTGTR